jgi:hypothetical protein
MRREWIDNGRENTRIQDAVTDTLNGKEAANFGAGVGEKEGSGMFESEGDHGQTGREREPELQNTRPRTPDNDVQNDDEDLFNVTPKLARTTIHSSGGAMNSGVSGGRSIFGNPIPSFTAKPNQAEPDDDELDALMAEDNFIAKPAPSTTGKPVEAKNMMDEDEDEMEAMREMGFD